MNVGDIAEVDVEDEGGSALRHHLLSVEVVLHRLHIRRGDGFDMLQSAQQLIGRRDDAQFRTFFFPVRRNSAG